MFRGPHSTPKPLLVRGHVRAQSLGMKGKALDSRNKFEEQKLRNERTAATVAPPRKFHGEGEK